MEYLESIKFKSLLMNLHKQKIHGIVAGELLNADVDNCFTVTNDVGKKSKLLGKKPFAERIIIGDDNKYYKGWLLFILFVSLISSYFYAYMAAFRAPKPGDSLHYWMIVFESTFLLDMVFKFLKSFTKDGETVPTTDLAKIARRYLRGQFAFDFIPLIPIASVFEFHGDNHLYIIKCIRVINCFALFDIRLIMADVRKIFTRRLDKIIANDPLAATDKTIDQNKISQLIIINFILRITKLAAVIVNICYFLGLIWYILCDVSMNA